MTEQVGWVSTGAGEVFACLHLPEGAPRATTVVLAPPFGWEGIAAGRNLRAWARDLAAAGYPTVRYHPPGEGDSSGLGHEQDVDTWSSALFGVVAHARSATDAQFVTVLGLGLGGLVAQRALHDGAAIDDLVLWATPSKGRLLLRELRAFAAAAVEPGEAPVEATDEALWVHGYPLGARAQEQLQQLDAATLSRRGLGRALVLGRGTLRPDARTIESLEGAGVEVAQAPGTGYDELTLEPRISEPPTAVAASVLAWLRPEAASSGGPGLAPVPFAEQRINLGDVDAVLTRVEDAELTAVFVGAGAIPRSGPNRLWTEAARRWADWGVSSLRLDLYGIGEGPGDHDAPLTPEELHDASYRGQVQRVLDRAVELGLPDRFVLIGLCSGGFWAGQVALDDPRVTAALILNPGSLVWPPPLMAGGLRTNLLSWQTWRNFVGDPEIRRGFWSRALRTVQVLAARWRKPESRAPVNSLEVLLALEASHIRVTVALSPGEAEQEDLDRLPDSTWVDVHHLQGPRGAHTLSPAVLRAQTQALLDDRMRQLLARDSVRP